MTGKERLLTGLQPSGDLHIGNYFGALKPFLERYQDYESFLLVVDYHALTSLKNPEALRTNTLSVVKDYLAVGVDPDKAALFKQSDVPEHTELAWIFNCLVTVPFLMQAHAYKDKVAKGLEANAGLFTYPMLMAADILLYDADVVPVGEDQRQHLEYTREAAAKFNNTFGKHILAGTEYNEVGDELNKGPWELPTFKEPKELILSGVGVVPGTDGQKMSKSYKNTIPLFGTKDEIAKAVMSIVTDSGTEEETKQLMESMASEFRTTGAKEIHRTFKHPINVYRIHSLFKSESELAPLYESSAGNYKALKEALVEDVEAFVAPMRQKRDALTDDDVKEVLKGGAEKARGVASAKMRAVKKAVGIL